MIAHECIVNKCCPKVIPQSAAKTTCINLDRYMYSPVSQFLLRVWSQNGIMSTGWSPFRYRFSTTLQSGTVFFQKKVDYGTVFSQTWLLGKNDSTFKRWSRFPKWPFWLHFFSVYFCPFILSHVGNIWNVPWTNFPQYADRTLLMQTHVWMSP